MVGAEGHRPRQVTQATVLATQRLDPIFTKQLNTHNFIDTGIVLCYSQQLDFSVKEALA